MTNWEELYKSLCKAAQEVEETDEKLYEALGDVLDILWHKYLTKEDRVKAKNEQG